MDGATSVARGIHHADTHDRASDHSTTAPSHTSTHPGRSRICGTLPIESRNPGAFVLLPSRQHLHRPTSDQFVGVAGFLARDEHASEDGDALLALHGNEAIASEFVDVSRSAFRAVIGNGVVSPGAVGRDCHRHCKRAITAPRRPPWSSGSQAARRPHGARIQRDERWLRLHVGRRGGRIPSLDTGSARSPLF